jgi:hypothetical protein
MTLPEYLQEESQRKSLQLGLARIHSLLTRVRAEADGSPPVADLTPEEMSVPDNLQRLCLQFGLTSFERDVLLLCTGVELQTEIANACAAAHGDPRARWATFGLALATLPEAHWSAVSPDRPLRAWRMLELSSCDTVLSIPIRIDEMILHFIAGVACHDARLTTVARNVSAATETLSAPQAGCAAAVAQYWAQATNGTAALKPVLLVGRSSFDQTEIAHHACRTLGWHLASVSLDNIPSDNSERAQFARLWNREALLSGAALLIRSTDFEGGEPLRWLRGLLDQLRVPVALAIREGGDLERLDGWRITIPALDGPQSRQLWMESLGPLASRLNGGVDRIVEHFRFDSGAIRFAGALARNAAQPGHEEDLGNLTWNICRTHARRSLQQLALRIEPKARWQDLVLPKTQVETLKQIVAYMRQRNVVHGRWGFADRYSRGLGATALFAGSSGTGKTMAAEVIGAELDLDLYQIDLSSVVSKYIGETEKNLRRVFDAAEESAAVLLFDEADALFGKRSEVRDSHDRYANIEVSYLLQRMEAYSGLAILTTNMKSALDDAFLRRIRFIIQFPFPDLAGRQRIWERVFPGKTPVGDLNFGLLARLNVSGGVIRNIATHAAFLAAEEGKPVTMEMIRRAAQVEYAKLERPLTAAEAGGWA